LIEAAVMTEISCEFLWQQRIYPRCELLRTQYFSGTNQSITKILYKIFVVYDLDLLAQSEIAPMPMFNDGRTLYFLLNKLH
jgi:hypothetical protein